MKKLAIVTSHPIQYNAPLFRLLTERGKIALQVFYTWGQTAQGLVYDPDFKKTFQWDIPLTEGYAHVFIENISVNPGAGHFRGIQNRDLPARIAAYEPDALLIFGWSFQSHLQVLRHFAGKKKMIIRGDSTLLDEAPGFSLKKLLRRLLLHWVYRHVDYAMYAGQANKAYFLLHGLKEDQLLYAPHAVANERFTDTDGALAQAALRLREQLGIPAGAFVYVFAGKLEPKKDPLLLIEVFQQLEGEDLRLVLTGTGVLEEEAKQRAKKDPRIHFLGFQNQQQMPVVYRLGDVFVLPSRGPGETWGLSVNEAMASGRPVIVSNRCGCAQDLVNGNGIIFEAGSADSLKKALLFFAGSKSAASEMGRKSLALISDFTPAHVARVIEQMV